MHVDLLFLCKKDKSFVILSCLRISDLPLQAYTTSHMLTIALQITLGFNFLIFVVVACISPGPAL